MRQSLQCPQCESKTFYDVAKVRTLDHANHSGAEETSVACEVEPPGFFALAGERLEAKLVAFVCGGCGFVEFCCRDLPVLAAMAAQGKAAVRVVEKSADRTGPFR